MAQAPLPQVMAKWQQRLRYYGARGIPTSKMSQLMQQDISNVAQGKQAMTPVQVYSAVTTAQNNNSTTGGPQPQGLSGNFLKDLGVIGHDVAGIPENFLGGLVNTVQHLPSEATNTIGLMLHSSGSPEDVQWRQQHGMPDSGYAALASDKSLISWLPGMSVVGQAATPEGRNQLGQHPVSDILNVAPFVRGVGKGVAGSAASKSDIAAQAQSRIADYADKGVKTPQRVTRADIQAATDKAINESQFARGPGKGFTAGAQNPLRTPREALQQGNPYAAGAIGASNLVRAATKPFGGIDTRAAIVSLMERKGIDANAREHAFRAIYDTSSRAGMKANRFIHSDEGLGQFVKNEKDFQRLSELAGKVVTKDGVTTNIDTGEEIAPKDVAALKLMDEYGNLAQEQAFQEGNLGKLAVPGEQGKFMFYPMDSPVIKAKQNWDQAGAKLLAEKDRHRTHQRNANAALKQMGEDVKKVQAEVKSARQPGLFDNKEQPKSQLGQSMLDRMDKLKEAQKQSLASLAKAEQNHIKAATNYHQELQQAVPAAYHPMAQEHLRNLASQHVQDVQKGKAVNTILAAHDLETVISKIKANPMMNDLEQYVGPEQFSRMLKESANQWMKWRQEGYAPVLTFNHIDPVHYNFNHIANPLVWDENRGMHPNAWRNKLFNETPGTVNIAVGLGDIATDHYNREAAQAAFDDFLMPENHGIIATRDSLREQYSKITEQNRVERAISDHYIPVDPRRYGADIPGGKDGSGEQLMMRKSVKDSLDKLEQGKGPHGKFIGAYDKGLNVWRYSVLTGPRHWVHVMIGGLMMATLRGPDTIMYLGKAARYLPAMRRGDPLPEHLHALNLPLYMIPGRELFNFSAHKSLGRVYRQWLENAKQVARGPAHFEEMLGSWLRIATYLRAGAKGLDHEAALREALRTYIDMGSMHPFERQVVRQVFPFYAFTKHILRYVVEYPVDHPIRAAILANFANNEIQDYNANMPQKFSMMFNWGPPDANGNTMATDFKNVNPFRSLGNDFSLAGFMSGLNPAASAALTGIGVNVLSGSPELYPQLAINPVTGAMMGQNPDAPTQVAEQLIPEFGVVDHYLQLSGQMRALAARNPGGFDRQLLSSLNIPFETSQINPAYEAQKLELNKFRLAQTALSKAVKTGDWTDALRFQAVPFNGRMVDPRVLQALYQREVSSLNVPQGVSPKALVRHKKGQLL